MPPYNMVFRSAQGLSDSLSDFMLTERCPMNSVESCLVHMIAKCLAGGILHILLHVCLMNSDNQTQTACQRKHSKN